MKRFLLILLSVLMITGLVACTPGGGEITTDDTEVTDDTTVADETTAAQIVDVPGYETWVVDWNHELFVDFDLDLDEYKAHLASKGVELTDEESRELTVLGLVLSTYHNFVLKEGYSEPIPCLYTTNEFYLNGDCDIVYFYNPIAEADDPNYEYKGCGIPFLSLLIKYRIPASEETTG